ncbi:peptide transporter MTD1 [Hyaloscypha hepaticicola]|uniref:Peptide transporter MTD1 n=1 Tax=Hyaloscypha hepaticicola TaxID=2082293 RepID=A0A2J6Q071_9HELO|nr:peptide transporter MTD1 [Hyaloscypha hepaticicola]
MPEDQLPPYRDHSDAEETEAIHHPADKDDILTHTIHIEDDPTLNAITFRTIFLGTGLSLFGGTISAIYYFKPQTVSVSTVFLAVITYMLGELMAFIIPKKGIIGRWLNPHPFNVKEHLAIVIMANSASISALGIEVLAVEQLYYGNRFNGALSVFLLFSSQFLGYGIAGLMRKVLVYPKNMLWPSNLPVNSMLETLHRPRELTRKPLKVFLIVFACIFVWEIVPEWIMPLLTGVSIFCLANQNSAVFTNVFGGASGDEGLGLFSWCFDWQYISGGFSPLYYPMDSLISQGIGICGCVVLFSAAYYGNLWNAQNFPFLSQSLFSGDSNATNPIVWNQTAVIGSNNRIDPVALAVQGLPYFATTYGINLLVTNMSVTACFVHLCLWYWKDMKAAIAPFRPSNLRRLVTREYWTTWKDSAEPAPNEENYDPHYKLMMQYKAVPDWWFGCVLLLSFTIAMIILYTGHSTLPWWGFVVAMCIGYVFLVFFGAMMAISGVQWLVQPIVQMIGGYIQPGNPVANMYFSLYGYNALIQGQLLSQDLKLAQYGHLAPRVTFTMQMAGTAVGAVFNYIMTNQIITNQFDTLLSIEGTNVWSGQQAQAFNSLAVAWGGLSHELFSVGGTYQWMTLIFIPGFFVPIPFWLLHKKYPTLGLNNINTAIMILYLSWLCVGINSSLMAFFFFGLVSQIYIRKRYPTMFVKYNYLVSAALDGGTSVIVFILSFAVFGAAGNTINFPIYWGNNLNGNFDRCLYTGG